MIKKTLLVISFIITNTSFIAAQLNIDTTLLTKTELDKEKIYTDLNEALKTPEKVIVLDLSGQQLDSLGESVGQFTNLQVLRVSWKIKASTPKSIIRQSKKTGGGIIHLDGLKGKYVNYNHLTHLPASLVNLKKLQEINLGYNLLTEVPFYLSQLKHLRFINFIGCYGLINKEDDLKKFKTLLPSDCILWTDLRLDE